MISAGSQHSPPLIVGAGPVGLAAALFLARTGLPVRLVEQRDARARQSRALAVNPRTLEILEASGVTDRLLALGRRIRAVRFSRRDGPIAEVSMARIHPRYPFMLALSQAVTERLLGEAIEAAGGRIERGVKLTDCRQRPGGVEAVLETAAGAETLTCPWLLAADGAHSTVRERLGTGFPGSRLSADWHLADVRLRTNLEVDHGHAWLLEDGEFLFLIPVVEDAPAEGPGPKLWRVLGNRPDPLSRLINAEAVGEPAWVSTFGVPHRLVTTMSAGRVFYAGDAAHVHSPIGARGMNLGIEDAWVFVSLLAAGRLDEYHQLRHSADRAVVTRVRLLSSIISGETGLHRLIRRFIFPRLLRSRAVRPRLLRAVTGLDHDLPPVAALP